MNMDSSVSLPDPDAELQALTGKASGMGLEVVEVSAFLDDLDAQARTQAQAVSTLGNNTARLAQLSDKVRVSAHNMLSAASASLENVQHSTSRIAESNRSSLQIAEWVRSVNDDGETVEKLLRAIQVANNEISGIASTVTILAVNAKIEAARAGQAGKGFSIVADSVNELSQKTTEAADSISKTVTELSTWLAKLNMGAQESALGAGLVLEQSAETDTALGAIEQQVGSMRSVAGELSAEAEQSQSSVEELRASTCQLDSSLTAVTRGIKQATQRCFGLVDTSEAILQHAVAAGGNARDGPMITIVQDLAGQMAQGLDRAIDTGQISLRQLMSDAYVPIPNTNPAQVLAPFTRLTDALFPAIQEPVLEQVPNVVFCAAVDRNGYLPTHNKKFSHPQSDDPEWNAGHCRNRRIFDDRVGLKAGQSTAPFLLQVYRRDMGGGNFTMMKDLSAPIVVKGQHWGGLRLAYKF